MLRPFKPPAGPPVRERPLYGPEQAGTPLSPAKSAPTPLARPDPTAYISQTMQDRKSGHRGEKRQKRQVARDISYASSAASKTGRAMIRVMENATGRLSLIKRADGYDEEVRQGGNFWEIMVQRYGVTLDVVGGSLDNIPAEGPVVVVANHPYGILDGLILGYVMSKSRGDFRILAHRVFRKAEDLDRIILPISFDETKEAVALNIQTRKEALRYLARWRHHRHLSRRHGVDGGQAVFAPARPEMAQLHRPHDRQIRSDQVVPIFFDGQNSRLFQMASHLHATLRTGLFIKEFKSQASRTRCAWSWASPSRAPRSMSTGPMRAR